MMMLAPTPSLTSQCRHMGEGLQGVRHTVAVMRALVNTGKCDLAVRQAATSLVWLQPERDEWHEVQALYEWVRDRVRYVRDIVDVETLTSPAKTLQTMIGDCDDQAVLLAALFESVGYPTRFVVGAYTIPNHFEHVYLQVFVNDEWIDCDPTERQFLGWGPENALTLAIEGAI